jgi:4-oxalocrotonate tautomerase family enzyme
LAWSAKLSCKLPHNSEYAVASVRVIICHIATGLSQSRKTQLIRDVVKVTHQSIGSDPKIIKVILHEHPEHNMSISGRILGDAPS